MYVLAKARVTRDHALIIRQAGDGTHHVPSLALRFHEPARVCRRRRLLFLLWIRATEERAERIRYLVEYVLLVFLLDFRFTFSLLYFAAF